MACRACLGALGLEQCIVAAGGAAPMPLELPQWYPRLGLNIAKNYERWVGQRKPVVWNQ